MPHSPLRRRISALKGILEGGDLRGKFRLFREVARKNLREARLRREVRLLHGPAVVPRRPGEVLVLCCLRDGMVYLPHFLRHHRRLGVSHFVFLDNDSVDGTVDHLRAQPDVTVYASRLPFSTYKFLFKRFLARAHGRDRWTLLVDIDECFDFPGSDRLSLPQFVEYLEGIGCDAVVGHMLDLFSNRPILAQPPAPEPDLAAVYRNYELTGVVDEDYSIQFGRSNRLLDPGIRTLSGGVRRTFFGSYDLLTKHPLFRWHGHVGLTNSGHDITGATVADVSAVLLHYKFTGDFSRVLQRALDEKSYYAGSRSYAHIAEILRQDPRLTLITPASHTFDRSDELVESGFLRASDRYRAWVDARTLVTTEGRARGAGNGRDAGEP